jgi:N-acetylglucosamine-6-sulfatase
MMPFKQCLALLAALAAGAFAPAMAAPHIVVIMADDLDVHTVETLLARGLLPNLKTHVVDRGVRFTQSFVSNPLCAPSRSTYLSGRYSHNHGVLRNNAVRNVDSPDAPRYGSVVAFRDSSTIATWLYARSVPYRTGHLGKYVNGYGLSDTAPESSPLNPRYVPPGWEDWQGLIDLTTYNVYNYSINDNRTRVNYGAAPEDYQTAVLAERARQFITDPRGLGRPMFLSVTPLAPHVENFSFGEVQPDGYADLWRWYIRPDPRDETRKPVAWNDIFQTLPLAPRQKPSFNEADVSDKPSNLRRPRMTEEDIGFLDRQYRTRFASMLAVDDLVGGIVSALGSQLANTVIIFTSDNGFLYGEHRMAEKLVAYEESIRVPLYIAGPGIAGPRSVDAMVLNNDLAPTIAELAGALPQSPIDGRSLVPLLTGARPADWRKRFLVEHWSSGDAVDVPSYAAVRTGPDDLYPNRLLVEYFGDPIGPRDVTALELYDVTADPQQMESRHADSSDAAKAELAVLHLLLQRLRSCGATGASLCGAAER